MAINEFSIDPAAFANTPRTSEDFQYANFRNVMPSTGELRRFSDAEMRMVHNMLSRWTTSGLDSGKTLDNFNRFYSIFPEMEMPQDLKTYIFVTRPEMNLLGSSGGNGYSMRGDGSTQLSADNVHDARLRYLFAMNPEIVHMLTAEYSSLHKFIPYLQSRAESLQLPDYQIRTSELSVPFYSYKFNYPTVTNESITGGSFDISFRDDIDMRIMKMMQFWIYYQDAVIKNKMSVSKEHLYDNSYDFMCSVFEIICDPTSERILFWAKYTGCFPTSVPISNLSYNLRGNTDSKVSISFNYSLVEAMEPAILSDFNSCVTQHTGSGVETYDSEFGMSGSALVGAPFIVETANKNGLLLKWKPMVSGRSSNLPTNAPSLDNFSIAESRATAFKNQTIPDTKYTYRGVNPTARGEQAAATGSRALSNHIRQNTDRV